MSIMDAETDLSRQGPWGYTEKMSHAFHFETVRSYIVCYGTALPTTGKRPPLPKDPLVLFTFPATERRNYLRGQYKKKSWRPLGTLQEAQSAVFGCSPPSAFEEYSAFSMRFQILQSDSCCPPQWESSRISSTLHSSLLSESNYQLTRNE